MIVDDLYSASSVFVAGQAVGTDFITLVVALPALIISIIRIQRGFQRARLVWLGIQVYLIYNYILTTFMVNFNALFLV
ncbi:hypothetical protein ACFLYP_04165, partial [Chloroflexota bacterium]